MSSLRLLTLCLLLLVQLPAHASTKRALLVGVWNYPHLDESLQLRGPKNDVEAMRELLQQRGFSPDNIRLLSDGVEGSLGSPTRQAILDALAALTAEVQPGDFVYLHFGGHGSQQPVVDDPDEPDGLDEVFLPADTKGWADAPGGEGGAIENAISDNTIREVLEGLRARGAFVWIVFDSCHSGTMTRGVQLDEVRYRKASPAALGIPPEAMERAVQSAVRSRGAAKPEQTSFAVSPGGKGQGSVVEFFAAQTTQVTPEMRLPLGDPKRKSMGVFSYTLAQVVASNPTASYRQVAQQVIEEYARGRQQTMPMFAGDGLDNGVFGDQPVKSKPQWRVEVDGDAVTVKGGSLHHLAPGSILALLPSPTATDDEVVGYLKVIDSELLSSQVQPVAYADKPAQDLASIKTGNYARLASSRIQLRLRVARLPADHAATSGGKQVQSAIEALTKAQQAAAAGDEGADDGNLLVDWVDSADDADIRLALCTPQTETRAADGAPVCLPGGEQLWLLPLSGELVTKGANKTHSIGLQGDSQAFQRKLAENLKSIAKFHNLLRLSSQVGSSAGFGDARVETQIQVERKASGQTETILPGQQPTFYNGDKLLVQFRNQDAMAADVTVLFLDSAYGITPVFPRRGRPNRIEGCRTPSQPETCPTLTRPLGTVNAKTTGVERILVISVEAEADAPRSDFTFLAQKSVPRSRAASMDRGRSGLVKDLLSQAGFGSGPATRGLDAPSDTTAAVEMQLFNWTTAKQPEQ